MHSIQQYITTTIHSTNSTINHASQGLHSYDDMRRTTVIYAVAYASTVAIENAMAMDTTINDNWWYRICHMPIPHNPKRWVVMVLCDTRTPDSET